ncbi:MAG: phytanoyl-CoA dioxygenase family protein [Acidobacteriota bacterium]
MADAAVTRVITTEARQAWRALGSRVAQARFELAGRRRRAPLGPVQVESHLRNGYLLASGLIPKDVVEAATAAAWECTGADPDRPNTWAGLGPHPHFLDDERLLACYDDDVLAAAAQLVGDHPATYARPRQTMTVNRLPISRSTWRRLGAHLDYSLPEWHHRSLPPPFRIAAMTYLTPVRSQGGATVVWPKSHRRVAALARSDPGRFELLSDLNEALASLDLEDPIEIEADPGDVLFLDAYCVHAGSDNLGERPRLAINRKW